MKFNMSDVTRMLDEADDLVAILKRDLGIVDERVRFDARDGYPSGSFGGGSGVHGISDPVGIIATSPPDPIRVNAERMASEVRAARDSLRTASSARANALPVMTQPERKREDAAPICVNCGGLALWTDRKAPKAGRCPSCYMYRVRHDGMDKATTKVA